MTQPFIALTSPTSDAVVSEVTPVEGRFVSNSGSPVLFVRPLERNAHASWLCQEPMVEAAAGTFSGHVRCDGPVGSRFEIIACLSAGKDAAAKFKPGTELAELPPSLAAARSVLVYRDFLPSGLETYSRVIDFSGFNWEVKAGRKLGPGPNTFSDAPESVWLDDAKHLHLALRAEDDKWKCAEVMCDRSLGYGEYLWVVSGDLTTLDRHAVLGLFTYENRSHEIDFELSRWGDATKPNAQFVVQPYDLKDHMFRFDTRNAPTLTISVDWKKGRMAGRCWAGADRNGKPLAEWTYPHHILPEPGKERVRMNLWLLDGHPPAERQEVIVESFTFNPFKL